MRYFDAGQTSANGVTVAKPVELKYPLWWADGTNVSTTVSVPQLLQDGTTTLLGSGNTVSTSARLHTLSSNWSIGTKFAIEVTMYTSNAASTATAQLFDVTSNTASLVSGTSVTTTSTSATTLRSGQFTLTGGRSYCVAFNTTNATYYSYVTDASLIVFPS